MVSKVKVKHIVILGKVWLLFFKEQIYIKRKKEEQNQ